MRRTFSIFSVLLAGLFLTAGCQRLNYEKTVTVGPGNSEVLVIDPPSVNQDVKVDFKSSKEPVSVYIVLEENAEAVKQKTDLGGKPEADKIIAGKEKVMEGTVEGKVPAKKGYQIIIGGATKDTEVTVKVTGK
jgi:hypothetical protein